jgi:hypothetical protein
MRIWWRLLGQRLLVPARWNTVVKASDGPNGMRDGNQTQDMPYSVGSSTPRPVDVWDPLRLHDQRRLVLRGGILSTRPVVGTTV